MLLNQKTLQGIAEGRITLAFRRWKRPMAKPGGTQRTPIGVLEYKSVEPIDENAITDEEARKAGEKDRQALLKRLRPEGRLYRIEIARAGDDPRIALRQQNTLEADDVETIQKRLDRMDKAAANGPWTAQTLQLIADNPEIRAADLAPQLDQQRLHFKTNVRKLKELGLTISLERGYRLSPRGEAYLTATRAPRR